jgi:hypothetical protein
MPSDIPERMHALNGWTIAYEAIATQAAQGRRLHAQRVLRPGRGFADAGAALPDPRDGGSRAHQTD